MCYLHANLGRDLNITFTVSLLSTFILQALFELQTLQIERDNYKYYNGI